MEFIDLLLNYFIGLLLGLPCVVAVGEFALDKAGAKNMAILQIILQFFWLPVAIGYFGFESGSNMSKGPIFSPYWGIIKYQALHYLVWVFISYQLDRYDRRRQALKK
jgi:hypothetical protein